ncbi:hypothetical protein NL676_021215 [Syzygium grande]|nr:hypothetical protein NL676_021215 [Syzygium grande]
MKGTHQPTGASAALATDHPPVVSALQVVNGSDLSNANAAASRGQSSALNSLQAAPTLQAVPASDATIAATSVLPVNEAQRALGLRPILKGTSSGAEPPPINETHHLQIGARDNTFAAVTKGKSTSVVPEADQSLGHTAILKNQSRRNQHSRDPVINSHSSSEGSSGSHGGVEDSDSDDLRGEELAIISPQPSGLDH